MDIGVQLKILQMKIEESRRELQLLWDNKQMTDSEVLVASIKLDSLINTYQSLQRKQTDEYLCPLRNKVGG